MNSHIYVNKILSFLLLNLSFVCLIHRPPFTYTRGYRKSVFSPTSSISFTSLPWPTQDPWPLPLESGGVSLDEKGRGSVDRKEMPRLRGEAIRTQGAGSGLGLASSIYMAEYSRAQVLE